MAKKALSEEAKLVLLGKDRGGILKRILKTGEFQMYVPHGGFANVKEETVQELVDAKRLPKAIFSDYLGKHEGK